MRDDVQGCRRLLGVEEPTTGRADDGLDPDDEQMMHRVQARVVTDDAPAELRPALSRIGHYEVQELLDQGAMGKVYVAMHTGLRRKVALKLQKEREPSPQSRERMLREARLLARLEHPHVVKVHDVGEHEGRVYLTMELVEGRTLRQLQDDGDRGWEEILRLYIGAGRGLAAAHDAGLVHRDFKPDNVVVDRSGMPRVLDFGLARATEELQATQVHSVLDSGAIDRMGSGNKLTVTGAVLGTPAYMAPEVLTSKPATLRSDQFSFCVALYEALYGRLPFRGKTPGGLLMSMQDEGPRLPPGDRPAIPKWLFRVLVRGLRVDARERHPSMAALLAELERNRRFPWGPALGLLAVVGVAGLVLGVWWLQQTWAALAEQRRCAVPVQQLRASWTSAREGLMRSVGEADDEAVGAWLDAEVETFVERWEASCVDDTQMSQDPCRQQAAADFEWVLDQGRHQRPLTAMISGLADDLELCLESRPASACQGPHLESEAPERLGQARRWFHSGGWDQAQVHAQQSLTLAEGDGDVLTQVRARVLLGAIARQVGVVEDARAALDDALADAIGCGDDVLVIDAALERAEVEVLGRGRVEDARRSLRVARRLLERPSMEGMTLRWARLLEKEGVLARDLEGDCTRGLERLGRSLQLREQQVRARAARGEPTAAIERLVANARTNYASTLAECEVPETTADDVLREFEAARAEFMSAVTYPDHPERADFEFNLGNALRSYHRYEGAVGHFEEAQRIYALHHGDQSPAVGEVHRALAETQRQLGRLEQAREHAQANLDICLHTESNRLSIAEAYDAVAVLDVVNGQPRHAVPLHRKAIDAIEATASDHPLTAMERWQVTASTANLAEALSRIAVAEGDDEAAAQADRAVVEARQRLDVTPDEEVAVVLRVVEGRLWGHSGEIERACAVLGPAFAGGQIPADDESLLGWVAAYCPSSGDGDR